MQQALLSEISARIRAVAVRWEDRNIHFVAYVDGPVTEEDVDAMACSETEVMALFPSSHAVTHEVVRLDEPLPIPQGMDWVYRRLEA